MKISSRHIIFKLLLITVFLLGSFLNAAGQELVRAKLGMEILTGDTSRLAKSRDRLKAGNQLRLYIMPESDSYVYVINSDKKNAVLLNPQTDRQKFSKGTLEVFPSTASLYEPGSSGRQEIFTVVCSVQPLAEITDLFSAGVIPYGDWTSLEKKLVEKSNISLGEKLDKPFAMAGTVRDAGTLKTEKELMVFSGKNLLVKSFNFEIKK